MKSKTTAAAILEPDETADRVARLDWKNIAADLDEHGCTVIGPLITPEQCVELAACYDTPEIFRSHVVMAPWIRTRGISVLCLSSATGYLCFEDRTLFAAGGDRQPLE